MSDANLADLFERMARQAGDDDSVVCDHVRLSYRELDERSTRLAGALAALGVDAGDRVALFLGNCHEHVEALLAAFKLRAIPLNVNYQYVAGELRALLDDSGAIVVIHDEDLGDVVREATSGLGAMATLATGASYEAALAAHPPDRRFGTRSGDDRYVLYTGGTTGAPKGVVWRHADVFAAALAWSQPDGDGERRARHRRVLVASPLMHGTGQWSALATLLAGGCVLLPGGRGFDARRCLELAARERATFLVIVGDAFARPLVDALDDISNPLPHLAVVHSGGAVLSPAMKEALAERLPTALVVDGYGTSETGGHGQMATAAGARTDPGPPRFRVSADTAVVDDDLRPVPPGAVGYLARRGHVPLGYLNDHDASHRVFRVADGERWAIPGDLAAVEDDGTVVLLGRGSTSINTGGEKVYPHEVEAVIAEHPSVGDVVVVGAPDERWGERVVAVVAPAADRDPTLDDLAEHCRGRLAPFKIPRSLAVVGEIARTPTGKADYRWARAVADRAARQA